MPQRTIKEDGYDDAHLVEVIHELTTAVAEIKADIAVLTAQLDSDTGVTDTDYAANVVITSPVPTAGTSNNKLTVTAN